MKISNLNTSKSGKAFLLAGSIFLLGIAQAAIPPSERTALINLYLYTQGDHWRNNDNWMGPEGTECYWFGVTCDATQTHVIKLRLSNNNLAGTLPKELGDLVMLENLSLSINQITGGIPPELGNLVNLEVLALSENQLTGTIPPEIGNLTSLWGLFLPYNQLSGTLPAELGNLVNLSTLDLPSNNLSGPIPVELSALDKLEHLSLANNHISGQIPPELGNLKNLQHLYLSRNEITGSIPPELGDLSRLLYLSLEINQLSGPLPTEIGNMTSLVGLNVSYNALSGPLPASLTNLRYLSPGKLDIRYNALYTDDSDLAAWLDTKQRSGEWRQTQTVAPDNLATINLISTWITFQWTPIDYRDDPGGYQLSYGETPGGPYPHDGGTTQDKMTGVLTLTGLAPDTRYCFVMRTWTDPHGDQQNLVWSDYSTELCLTTPADEDRDGDGLLNGEDKDQCIPDPMTITAGTAFEGPGNTRLGSMTEIVMVPGNHVEVWNPHELILESPVARISQGSGFRVHTGAEVRFRPLYGPCE